MAVIWITHISYFHETVYRPKTCTSSESPGQKTEFNGRINCKICIFIKPTEEEYSRPIKCFWIKN